MQEIAERFPEKRVCGVDYSERAINLAKGFNPELEFLQIDIVKETIDSKYDLLTLIEVFEHIPPEEADNFVKSLHGMMNDNGILLLTVPHKNKRVSAKHYQHFDSALLRHYFDR